MIRKKSLKTLIATISTTGLLCGVPAVAQAQPFEHEHFEGTESGSFDDCGFTIDFVDTFRGMSLIREVRGSDGQAFLAHQNYEYRTTLTNPDTGAWMVVRGKGMFKELTGTHVEGTIWEFTAMDVGQPFVVEDSSGNVVLRDRGRVALRAVFDTLGDSQPGGELLEEEITAVNGPHPGLDTDFCALAEELIG